MPDFLKNLNELIELYEKQGDFRAASFTKAAKSLDGHIITSVDDIEMYKLKELRGVGTSTIDMLQEFIQLGEIERLRLEKSKRHPYDHAVWFAKLPKEQTEYIKDWWDSEGEQKYTAESGVFGSCGIPFTFESEGDTYKVDGDAEDHEWEGRVHGVTFTGTIYKNGVKNGTFEMGYEVEGFSCEGDYQICVDEDEEEVKWLAEACREAFMDNYVFPDNMAYRE